MYITKEELIEDQENRIKEIYHHSGHDKLMSWKQFRTTYYNINVST